MTEQFKFSTEDQRTMIYALSRLFDETVEIVRSNSGGPSAGSKAENELKGHPDSESLRDAFVHGTVLIESTADQLDALVRTLTEPILTMAPWTCTRSILEASSLACWLLDPEIRTDDRVQRSLTLMYEGMDQQRKYANCTGDKKHEGWVSKRMRSIEIVAATNGYRQRNGDDKMNERKRWRMHTATDLVRDELDEECAYRLLSAIVHGHGWAFRQICFRRVEDEEKAELGPATQPQQSLIEKHLAPDSVALLAGLAGKSLFVPLAYKSRLFGWQHDPWDEILYRVVEECTLEVRGALLGCWAT